MTDKDIDGVLAKLNEMNHSLTDTTHLLQLENICVSDVVEGSLVSFVERRHLVVTFVSFNILGHLDVASCDMPTSLIVALLIDTSQSTDSQASKVDHVREAHVIDVRCNPSSIRSAMDQHDADSRSSYNS